MGLNTENLDYPYTNTKIRNCINNEFIHQKIKNLIIQEDYDKKHKIQNHSQYLRPVSHDSFDKDKNHKSALHSIEQYFTNAVSYKKLNKTKNFSIYNYLHKKNKINLFKAAESFKGCVTTGEFESLYSADDSVDNFKNDFTTINKKYDLNSSYDSWDENNNKKVKGTVKKDKIWCQLAYWEECQRVGPLQQISNSYIHVLHSMQPSANRFQTQSTKVPSSKKNPSTSLNVITGPKRAPSSPLSKTCVQYSNLHIVDSECSDSYDNTLSSTSDEKYSRLSSQGTPTYSKSPKSVIKEKKKFNKIIESSNEPFKVLESRDQLCLSNLFNSNQSPSISTTRTRNKIGKGIILSHEKIPGIPECDSNNKEDPFNEILDAGSPPYEKQRIHTTQLDEDLPPYSLHAPNANVKRRRKNEYNDKVDARQNSQNEDVEKRDFKACQTSGEENGEYVWLHNLSQIPVFVTSPTLEPLPSSPDLMKSNKVKQKKIGENLSQQFKILESTKEKDGKPKTIPLDSSKGTFTVHKILPGYAMKVFDYNKSKIYENVRKQMQRVSGCCNNDGPFDPHAIRISFAKGWSNSQGYSRSDITNCPCWIEMHLLVS